MGSSTEEKLWIICPVCHKANPAGSRFCQHCWGAAINQDAPLTTQELAEATKHRQEYLQHRKLIKIGIISASVLAVLLITFLSFFYWSDVIIKPDVTLNSASKAGDWAMFHHDLSHTGNTGAGSAIPQGILKWSFQADAPSRSSPAVADGTVYFGSQDYNLYAIDAESGQKRWEYQTNSWVESAPSVAGGKVYFGSNDGKLYAINTQSGQKVWEFKTTFPVRSSPAIAGNILYFGSDDYSLYALNPANGKLLWNYETAGPAQSPPVVANGIVYIGSTDGFVYGFNALTGQRRLRFKTHYAVYSGPVVDGTTVYAATTNGRLFAFNGMVRTRIQEHELKPLWAQVKLMFPWIPAPPEQSGYLWADDLTRQQVQKGSRLVTTSGGAANTSPVISENVMYLGIDKKLVAYDLKNQKKLWSFETSNTVRSSPAIANNIIYFGNDDGKLYAVDAAKGTKLWDFSTGGSIFAAPAIAKGIVYVTSDDGKLYAIK